MNKLVTNDLSPDFLKSLSTLELVVPAKSEIIPSEWPVNGQLTDNQIRLYKIEELSFDDEYPHREAFENVIQTMNDTEGYNLIYILEGNKQGITLYLGIVQNAEIINDKNLTQNIAGNLVQSFIGNFNGSKISEIESYEEIRAILTKDYKNAGIITGIPSINESNSTDIDFQGIDRLINSMLGLEWRIEIVCEPVSHKEIVEQQERVYELYTKLNLWKNTTIRIEDSSTNKESSNNTQIESDETGTAHHENHEKGNRTNDSNSNEHHLYEKYKNNTVANDKSISHNIKKAFQKDSVEAGERTTAQSHNFEIVNKRAQEILKYIDDEFLDRLKLGLKKGMFKTSVYFMANNPNNAEKLHKNMISLFQGNKVGYSPLCARLLTQDELSKNSILNTFQNHKMCNENYDISLVLSGKPFDKTTIGLCTYLTTRELSIIAGLPQKEVPGLTLKSAASFGVNQINESDDKIEIGKMVQKGRELSIPFYLGKKSFSKHVFIAGTTGSGKTTTCHTLLDSAKVPFLVIEPAKTEYRCLIKNKKLDAVVFTLGNETVAPFRLNPFELLPGEVITGHVDMIKATFTSAFPMEASMPQILEEAIYKCYEKKGWNIFSNENDFYENPFDPNVNSFPIMSDLIAELPEVVNSKNFDSRLKNDYTGSLVSRLSNLTIGSKGAMLNCYHSTSFEYIAEHNVIMELEGLRSQEDKSLIMGFILTILSSQIRLLHDKYRKEGKDYQHLTLIEEAHRLLSKYEPGDSGSKKIAVETFTDLLAEVRKYGEGLIIIDQIPNKLAPDVLKNTNTKIIQKLFSQDDKDAVGNTMLMDEEQRSYISSLPTGHAIVFTETTAKPVHVKIKQVVKTDDNELENDEVHTHFLQKKKELGTCYAMPELFHFVQTDFTDVVKELSGRVISVEHREKLLKKIKNISETRNIDENELWKKILETYDTISGKSMLSFSTKIARQQDMETFFELYRNQFEKITEDLIKGDSEKELFSMAPFHFLKKQ